MRSETLKDKPMAFVPAKPTSRRRRTWFLSIMTALALFCYYTFSSSTISQIDIHPAHGTKIDWHRFAYSQYATDQHYLCNSLMVFDSLEKYGSKADRLLFYPKTWDLDVSSSKDRTSQLLVMAQDKYKVKLRPVEMYTLQRPDTDTSETTWDASINKLHAFNQGEYNRIIHLDSDIMLFQHLDELFFLPSATIAMPRAYWKLNDPKHQGGGRKLTSLIVVLQPSEPEAKELWDSATLFDNTTSSSADDHMLFDMELLNNRYTDTALVLPHRNYALVTGEFRRPGRYNHTRYLGNTHEKWDPEQVLKDAKLVHFSDWPVPKPWIATPLGLLGEMQPVCEFDSGTPKEHGCEDRKIWKKLYDDFRRNRKDVCALLSVPAPEWPPRKKPSKQKPDGAV